MDHEGVRLLVRDLNQLYKSEPVLSRNDFNPQGFRWLACHDADGSVLAYLRSDPFEQTLFAVVGHYTPIVRSGYRIGVPRHGLWREMLNSNSHFYGGSGLGNEGGRQTEEVPCDGFSQSIVLTLPPMSTTIFKWSAEAAEERGAYFRPRRRYAIISPRFFSFTGPRFSSLKFFFSRSAVACETCTMPASP